MLEFKKSINIIETILKDFLFEKKRNSFVRYIDDVIQIIEIQKYTFKIEEKNAFTINIGLILPNTFEKVFGRNTTISYSEGIISFNIGELINDFNGRVISKYWLLENEELLKHELKHVFIDKLLPFLNPIINNKDVINFLEKNKFASKATIGVKNQIEELKNLL